ncbi:MAG: hypothetical protein HC850_14705 [Rhodomicrobium sp.]|nr:hypothetical protein [Rhodomicrobium sp.]
MAAEFDTLAPLVAEKNRMTNQLEKLLSDPHAASVAAAFRKRLAAIVTAAKENETLLASARAGVQSAQLRIQDIVNRQRNVGAYSESGEKVMAPDAGVSKRKLA